MQNHDNSYINNEYKIPPLELLEEPQISDVSVEDLKNNAIKLQKNLSILGINTKVENIAVGPTFTTYEIKLPSGVKVSRIENLKEDISFMLGAEFVNIEPISSKQVVAIEVKNEKRQLVRLKELIVSDEFKNNNSNLLITIGKEKSGSIKLLDIKKSSHILIGGSTGSGKSMVLNSVICSIIYKASYNDVNFIIIDTKNGAEWKIYNEIPHMLVPVISDTQNAYTVLAWLESEMNNRYNIINKHKCKNLDEYNEKVKLKKYLI
jgi:S-DNA-T family DNA segregation ATPase FtsK/SpoIIIE